MDTILKKRDILITLIIGALFGIVAGASFTPERIITQNITVAPPIECPVCRVCPPPTICPPCTECPTCTPQEKPCPPPQECPGCPVIECVDTADALDTVNKARPPAENWAWQDGFYYMRCLCQQSIGGNCSKFSEKNPNPQLGILSGIYLQGNKPEDKPDTITFLVDPVDLGFWVNRTPDAYNRTRWAWNDDQCLSSALRIYKL